MEWRRGRGWCTGCSVGGTPLWSGDVEEDGVQAAVLGVLLYGVETWKRMVYRLQCWGYSSMEWRRGRGWCTGCSVGGTPLWSGDVEEDGVQAAVLGVLLYGAETWVNKRDATQKLESFYNKCLRRIMHITREQQRTRHITSAKVRRWAGMDEALEDLISSKRLRWLGHVSRMEDTRLPKKLLFGWLHKKGLPTVPR